MSRLLSISSVWSACCVCVALTWGLSNHARAVSLLSNPGFESGLTGTNTALPGWQSYGANTYIETNATIAHSGTNYLKVYQAFTGSVNYDGVDQDYISGPGAVYSVGGWAYTAANDTLAGQNIAWIEVTFRDANANILALYRSALVATNTIASGTFPVGRWNDLAVTNQYDPVSYRLTNTVTQLVAPDGTWFVRCQIVFQGDQYNSAGSVYFDDMKLSRTGAPYGNMNIVWSDEFDGPGINTSIWTFDIGNNNGWGNNELEYYTSRTNNAYVANGFLHIVAQKESYGGQNYTSARMLSQGLFSQKYGRIEWRAQLPSGVGFWPALWLLGTNIASTNIGWPACGEIDEVENKGSNPFMVQGSLHSGSDETAIYNFTDGLAATNFNTYTMDWTTNAFLFYVDGHLYETQTSWGSSTTNAYPYPFNQPFFLLMNMAIGGNYLGKPSTNAINSGTVFPGEMLVDYVRVYSATDPLKVAIRQAGANLVLSWPSNIVCQLQAQTNLLFSGNGSNWFLVGTATNQIQITPSNHTAFYRLVTP
jgi:beta-glucanase (GH16 family)